MVKFGEFRNTSHTEDDAQENSRNDMVCCDDMILSPLKSNDPYRGRTAPLTSKRCILYIYSTNIGTEYFKHGI